MKNRSAILTEDALLTALVGHEARAPQYGVVIATLSDFGVDGQARVQHDASMGTLESVARSLVPLTSGDVGHPVAVTFERGDTRYPIILGKIQAGTVAAPVDSPAQVDVVRPRRLELDATDEIVLRCGGASITLTRAGKVMIRGTYLLSRSSGLHRILGAVLRLN